MPLERYVSNLAQNCQTLNTKRKPHVQNGYVNNILPVFSQFHEHFPLPESNARSIRKIVRGQITISVPNGGISDRTASVQRTCFTPPNCTNGLGN